MNPLPRRPALLCASVLLLVAACAQTEKDQVAPAETPEVPSRIARFVDHQLQPLAHETVMLITRGLRGTETFERREMRSDGEGLIDLGTWTPEACFVVRDDQLVPALPWESRGQENPVTISTFRETGDSRFIHLGCSDEKGATVAFQAQHQIWPGTPLQSDWRASEDDGELRLDFVGLDEGVWLEIRARGKAPRRLRIGSHRASSSRSKAPARIVLRRLLSAETILADAETGRRVLDATVRVKAYAATKDDALDEGEFRLHPDQEGRVALQLADREPFFIQVDAPGYETWTESAARIETLDIRLLKKR